jgi:hypothetical protein
MATRRQRRQLKEALTPIKKALVVTSPLRAQVEDGLKALKPADHEYLAQDVRSTFADSLELDAALREDHSKENRWDYLLGHRPTGEVVGLEPHSAKQDQITAVIGKKEAAKQQLIGHLKPGRRVSRWLWVASGTVHFADTEKARLRLDQSGIQFVGRHVLAKHLP